MNLLEWLVLKYQHFAKSLREYAEKRDAEREAKIRRMETLIQELEKKADKIESDLSQD